MSHSSKQIDFIQGKLSQHWVGDGFPVRTIFSYHEAAERFSPFLLLDYAGPANFAANSHKRGVGEHPHRGFETVTIVYQGKVEHRDSTGGGGKIGPGDVQWMTAAAGLVHEEFHATEFSKNGGAFEVVQLWVNLPAKDKRADPGYQSIVDSKIPSIELPENAGRVRVIAGEYQNQKGPARTFSPINVWDVRLTARKAVTFSFPENETTAVFVLSGKLQVGSKGVKEAEVVVFKASGTEIELTAESDAKILVLNGKPLNEPIVGHGPFVMNTVEEIHQAVLDYQSGKMGHLHD